MGAAGRRRRRRTADGSEADATYQATASSAGRRRWVVGGLSLAAIAVIAMALGPLGWRLPASTRTVPATGSAATSSLPSTASANATPAASGATLEFAPLSLDGRGDRRVAFDIPAGAAALARISNRGSGPFHVQTRTSEGAPDQVLVDTAGDYDGLLLFDALAGQHSAAFDVRSGGAWTITVEPVGLAPSWSGDVPLTGSGDDVALLDATADGTTGVRVQHLGQGPITVLAYTANGDLDQLVDVVGPIDETEVIPADTICFQVRAVGRWSLSPG